MNSSGGGDDGLTSEYTSLSEAIETGITYKFLRLQYISRKS